ncbi:MAG: hypothetical protein M5U34_12095 [Chloroflexi bacterium]|nr:hypothetical protein [Chloroflexota bacterium]
MKPYVLITIIILAIVLAIGVFLTLMYLQNRPAEDSKIIIVEGQEVVIKPAADGGFYSVANRAATGGGDGR